MGEDEANDNAMKRVRDDQQKQQPTFNESGAMMYNDVAGSRQQERVEGNGVRRQWRW